MHNSVNPFRVFLIVLVYYSIGIITETIFLPAFKYLAVEFDVSIVYIESAYGYFFYTFGLSMFFYGPFSDIYGRRACFLLGNAFSLLGILITYFAYNYLSLVIGILFLGLGFGSSGMLCRAVARDLFFGEQLLISMTRVNVIFIIFPTVSPILGSYLVTYFSWRAIVVFLGGLNVLSLIYTYRSFIETATLSHDRTLSSVLASYRDLFVNKVFMLQIIIGLMSGSIVMLYEAKTAYIFQEHFKLTPIDHAYYGLIPIIGVILATFITTSLVRILGASLSLFLVNFYLFVLMSSLCYFSFDEQLTLMGLLAIFTQIFFCNAFTFSVINTQAMESCITNVGRGSAMIGGIQNFGIGLVVSIVPLFHQVRIYDVALLMLYMSSALLVLNILKYMIEAKRRV